MTISDRLAAAARECGDRLALAFDGRQELTFSELSHGTSKLAGAALAAGLQAGDRVAVLLKNRPEYLVSYLGLARAGLVIVPINRRAAPAEVARIVTDAQARILITEQGYEDICAAVRMANPAIRMVSVGSIATLPDAETFDRFVSNGDPAFIGPAVAESDIQAIHYTSGTTGTARGVVRPHGANLAVARGTQDAVPVVPGDMWLNTLPMHSVGVYAFVIAPLLAGAGVVITEQVDPELTLDLVARYEVCLLHAVPTVWEMLMRGNASGPANRLASVRAAYWGGSPLPRGTAERLEQWMHTPSLGCYGSTEAPCISYSSPAIYASGRFDSSGPLYGGMVARIVDELGAELPAGEMGEVLLRGPALMTGYFNKPELTAAAIDSEGWYHTGDWARLDPDGALTVTDRKKDMIITGGENVYPGEVENVISAIEGVAQASVVGVPDALWGQSVWAFVVTDGSTLTEADVIAGCREKLAGFKTPKRVRFIEELPTNTTGKIQKGQLVTHAVELGNRENHPSKTGTR